MSVETKEAFEDLKEYPKVKDKIIYLPNGIDDHLIKKLNVKTFEFSLKENIILTVGRIGWRAKKHEVLLEAIEKINDLKNWKIYLVGSIEESFKNYIDEYFKRNPNLKNTVIFTGEILERRKLFEFYQKSKIFCLTSRKESFGLVLVEAGYFGNYIVSTDLPSARDITLNGTLGTLFNIGDSEELAKNLEYLMENEKILKENAPKIQKHIEKNFLWRSIVSKLNDEIIKKRHYHDSI